jgi:hypothetical protein
MSVQEGVPVTRFCTDEQWARLADTSLLKDKFAIATFLKSGTTLTQRIVQHLLQDPRLPLTVSPVSALPWIEMDSRLYQPLPGEEGLTYEEAMARFPGYKIHWRASGHSLSFKKVVYVARDGIDAAVSAYHHTLGFPMYQYSESLDHFMGLFLEGHFDFGSWFEHVRGWYEASLDSPSILFIWYEDLIDPAQKPALVRRIASHLDLPATDKLIDETVASTSFSAMRESVPITFDAIRSPGAAAFLRKGRAGTGKFDIDQRHIDTYCQKVKEVFTGRSACLQKRLLVGAVKK